MDYMKYAREIFPCMQKLFKYSAMKDLSDISQGEMAVLSYLTFHHNGASAGELSEAFGVCTSRTAAVLNTLEKKGYANRKPDKHDRRRVLVYVTEMGREEATQKHKEAITHMASLLRLMGKADAETFTEMIEKAASLLDEQRKEV